MVKKVLNMKRFIEFWKHFWIGIFRVIKQIGSVRGIIALILTWLLLSGVGVIFIGIVIKNAYLVGLGGTKEYVIVPNIIKQVEITSIKEMFKNNTVVKGVAIHLNGTT